MHDREHGSVAEPVDQTSGGGHLRDPSGEHLCVADSVVTQMADQPGPSIGGVSGAHRCQRRGIGPEASRQVGLGPAVGQAGLIVGGGKFVDLGQAHRGDWAFGDSVRALHHVAHVGVDGFWDAHGVADQSLNGEYLLVI